MDNVPFVSRFFLLSVFLLSGCGAGQEAAPETSGYFSYARYVDVIASENEVSVVTVSPFDGTSDTLVINVPVRNVVCMASNYVACLSAVGCDSVVTAVSGARYISDPKVRDRYPESLYDIGYESTLDLERIVCLAPDMVAAYAVSSAPSAQMSRVSSFGIPVLTLYDNFEHHPLARAEYVRLFGLLAGRGQAADSLFSAVESRYLSLSRMSALGPTSAAGPDRSAVKVLLNIPYGGAWYIPGAENYMSCLIRDAGGEVLGAEPGKSVSSVVTLEKALKLSREADFWLNTGWCRTREQLAGVNPMFSLFLAGDSLKIFNNIRRVTPDGGNDFWESGAVRPDLILHDLVHIFHPDAEAGSAGQEPDASCPGQKLSDTLYYYVPVI